jgi:hypothetical protein
MKRYRGLRVKLHVFLNYALNQVKNQLWTPGALLPGKIKLLASTGLDAVAKRKLCP